MNRRGSQALARRPDMAPLPRSFRPAAPQVVQWPRVEVIPETGGTEHFHWGVTAYQELGDDGSMRDSVQIEVEGANEAEAIARAQAIIERNWYRVGWVREACSMDPQLKGSAWQDSSW